MRTEYEFILRPLITEKAAIARDEGNAYLFEVLMDATKAEIRRAVEKAFNVEVESVRTMVMPKKPKLTRKGRRTWTSPWKKAVVSLKEGYSIDIMEGV